MNAKKYNAGKRLSVRIRALRKELHTCAVCGVGGKRIYLMYNDKDLPYMRTTKLRRVISDESWERLSSKMYGCCAFCKTVIVNRKLPHVDMMRFIKFLHYMQFTHYTVREYTLGVYKAHTMHLSDGSVQLQPDGSIIVINRAAITAHTRTAISSYNRYLRWERKVRG